MRSPWSARQEGGLHGEAVTKDPRRIKVTRDTETKQNDGNTDTATGDPSPPQSHCSSSHTQSKDFTRTQTLKPHKLDTVLGVSSRMYYAGAQIWTKFQQKKISASSSTTHSKTTRRALTRRRLARGIRGSRTDRTAQGGIQKKQTHRHTLCGVRHKRPLNGYTVQGESQVGANYHTDTRCTRRSATELNTLGHPLCWMDRKKTGQAITDACCTR